MSCNILELTIVEQWMASHLNIALISLLSISTITDSWWCGYCLLKVTSHLNDVRICKQVYNQWIKVMLFYCFIWQYFIDSTKIRPFNDILVLSDSKATRWQWRPCTRVSESRSTWLCLRVRTSVYVQAYVKKYICACVCIQMYIQKNVRAVMYIQTYVSMWT